jgi:nucleoid DNA-binding protein
VVVVRYADDFVVGFQHRTDAERFLKEFRERLAKFGLELNPDKTRLIEFGRFAARDRKQRAEGKPETFTFLGFTHYCGQRHKSGTFTVWRITAKTRMVANSRLSFNAGCVPANGKAEQLVFLLMGTPEEYRVHGISRSV